MASLDTASAESFQTPEADSGRRVTVEVAARTDRGKVRSQNEDHYLVARLAKSMTICRTSLPEAGRTWSAEKFGHLMIVADGMGGAAAGEQASATAVESVERFVLESLKWFLHLEGHDEHALFDELRQALEGADREVIERARRDPSLHGMGTTLTMAYSVATDLFIVHAGDSRAYLYRDGELQQLTTDHTLVQVLVQGGALTPEAARRHRNRNLVTNVIGGPREGVYTEIHKLKIADGDVLLLCSDGLTEPVDDAAIAATLAGGPDPEAICGRLVDQALERGGPDNVTVVVARYRTG